jgi:hypothetical protein
MDVPMDIELWDAMPSRPCRICFSLQGGSVFADFDVDRDQRLYLVRISFDGYGCCRAPADVGRMHREDSSLLLGMADRRAVEPWAVGPILRGYFVENEARLWGDALHAHGLI